MLLSEAELIEMENLGLRLIANSERKIQRAMGSSPGFADSFQRDLDEWEKHREDFKLLIALARDPSQRTSVSEPSSSVRPKPIKKSLRKNR